VYKNLKKKKDCQENHEMQIEVHSDP